MKNANLRKFHIKGEVLMSEVNFNKRESFFIICWKYSVISKNYIIIIKDLRKLKDYENMRLEAIFILPTVQ